MGFCPFAAIVAANIDGRVHNVRYRQNQFHTLHSTILHHLEELREAIRRDSGYTLEEVQAEVCLALREIRSHYSSLDTVQAMQKEYQVANGHDNVDNRHGVGIVYIVPTPHTLFYSIMTALCAALAAGNCIILEVCI